MSKIPTKTVVTGEEDVFESDYKYLSDDDVKAITLSQLAKLEGDLHSLRIAFVANGSNPNMLVGQDRPVGFEMARVEKAISTLESYFVTVL